MCSTALTNTHTTTQPTQSVRERPLTTLRDLLELKFDREPVPLDQVEDASEIMRRFCTGGMSLGALSRYVCNSPSKLSLSTERALRIQLF
jgi:glutamate synthase domain-containing protein 2